MQPGKETTGFSLIELMMVLAIVAILASLGLPGFFSFIQESRRSDAAMSLLELAAAMERFYSHRRSFSGATTVSLLGRAVSEDGHYVLEISVVDDGQAWSAAATPVRNGSQADDACYRYRLDSTGRKRNEDREGGEIAASSCWSK